MHLLTDDDFPDSEPAEAIGKAADKAVPPALSLRVATILGKRVGEMALSLTVVIGFWEAVVRIFQVPPYVFHRRRPPSSRCGTAWPTAHTGPAWHIRCLKFSGGLRSALAWD